MIFIKVEIYITVTVLLCYGEGYILYIIRILYVKYKKKISYEIYIHIRVYVRINIYSFIHYRNINYIHVYKVRHLTWSFLQTYIFIRKELENYVEVIPLKKKLVFFVVPA